MEQRGPHEIVPNARLECGAVVIDIRDVGGLLDILHEAVPGTIIVANRFDAVELPSVLASELAIRTSAHTKGSELQGSISYLSDADAYVQQDLFGALTYLIERHGYPEGSFQPIAQQSGGYLLAHKMTHGSVVSITFNEEGSALPGDARRPSGAYVTLPYYPEGAADELQSTSLEFLKLWGDLHDAISTSRRPKHALEPDAPALISIKDIRLSDDMLTAVSILTEYEAHRTTSDDTWPTLMMDTIDLPAVIALMGQDGAARLQRALRALALHYRLVYGRTGIMPTIDGHDLLQALARLDDPDTN